MPQPTKVPTPVLKKGVLYYADNGRTICVECAGQSALYSGYDISGQKVEALSEDDINYFCELTGTKTVSCEMGCTTVSA